MVTDKFIIIKIANNNESLIMQVHRSVYDMADFFKSQQNFISELTKVIIQVFLFTACLNSAGWLFFEADQAKLLSQHASHTFSRDEMYQA
jgi:hypothetical protein